MNKYNIKVGDYVETVDKGIGYVTSVGDNSFEWFVVKPRSIFNAVEAGNTTLASFNNIKTYYKRIGLNDFSKKKNKLERIEKTDICYATGVELVKKLNELIDHINAIQERLDEDDSTRTN